MSSAVRSAVDLVVPENRQPAENRAPAEVIPIRRSRPVTVDAALRSEILGELRALASFDEDPGT